MQETSSSKATCAISCKHHLLRARLRLPGLCATPPAAQGRAMLPSSASTACTATKPYAHKEENAKQAGKVAVLKADMQCQEHGTNLVMPHHHSTVGSVTAVLDCPCDMICIEAY